MTEQRSKSTLDSLKSVFNVFWKKPPLGAPAISILRDVGRIRLIAEVVLSPKLGNLQEIMLLFLPWEISSA